LHAALKNSYAQQDDLLEAALEGYIIDILRGEQLIEIQTGNFSALKPKLAVLLPNHPVRVVHPIPQVKWIIRQTETNQTRRKSPAKGRLESVFRELVYLPASTVLHPNFTLEVLLVEVEEVWQPDGKGSW